MKTCYENETDVMRNKRYDMKIKKTKKYFVGSVNQSNNLFVFFFNLYAVM